MRPLTRLLSALLATLLMATGPADGPVPRLADLVGTWSAEGSRKEPVFGIESMISVTKGPFLSEGYNLVPVDREGSVRIGADGALQLEIAARIGALGSCAKTTHLVVEGRAAMDEPGILRVAVAEGRETVRYDPACDTTPERQRDFAGAKLTFEAKYAGGFVTLRRTEPTGDFLFGARLTRQAP